MSVFVTLHDSIGADDVEDVILMAMGSWQSAEETTTEEVVVSCGNLPADWTATRLPAAVRLYDVPNIDASLLRACTAFWLGETHRLHVIVDADWNVVHKEEARHDELNFYLAEQLLANGFLLPASAVAGATRRHLQTQPRPFPASLAESIKWSMLLGECMERCRTPVFPGTGDILCKRGIDTDLKFFLKAQVDSLADLVREQPDFKPLLAAQLKFMIEGTNLVNVAFRATRPQYAIFAWLSIFLLRISYLRHSINDTAEALALLVRSIECYSTYYLAEAGIIRFDFGSFFWTANNVKVIGAGELWNEVLNRIDDSTKSALSVAISATETVIRLRNRGFYGHGVQKLPKQVFASYYSDVRRVLEAFEETDSASHARWTVLWDLSQPPSLSVLRPLIAKALSGFQRHR
ncbi:MULTISPECIES: hypothetical protein [unclassified Caballeronia]|uniref:hypothetical protein n=1 Tax=unclassified Caballeronia TaxID=2646786 RepID=UPI002028A716|nr:MULTISPECIES: hypothetical protein [unclassified Caballeronia]